MVENSLIEKFKRIFGVTKVTFDQPEPHVQEQECIFIEIDKSANSIRDGEAVFKVTGKAVMYAQHEKLPLGFFSKAIKNANIDDTKDLFFYEIEGNSRRYQNIVERSFSFVYFNKVQYDPEHGLLTSVDFS